MTETILDVENKMYMIKELADAVISLSISALANENFEAKPTFTGMCAIGEMIRKEAEEAIECMFKRGGRRVMIILEPFLGTFWELFVLTTLEPLILLGFVRVEILRIPPRYYLKRSRKPVFIRLPRFSFFLKSLEILVTFGDYWC